MPNPIIVRTCAFGVLAAAAGLVSCSDTTGLGQRAPVSLSLSATRTSSASLTSVDGRTLSVAPLGSATDRLFTGNGHALNLQSADLTLSDLRLAIHEGDEDDREDSDHRHPNDGVFRTGPITVALPLDGGVLTPLTGEVPFGTYDRLRADLEFLRLRGTYDGKPLDVTMAIHRKLSLALRPPLVVDADHPGENVTLNVNVFSCFSDGAGAPIDLGRLNQDAALRESVHRCISRTLRAYRDHDRNGEDSDHG